MQDISGELNAHPTTQEKEKLGNSENLPQEDQLDDGTARKAIHIGERLFEAENSRPGAAGKETSAVVEDSSQPKDKSLSEQDLINEKIQDTSHANNSDTLNPLTERVQQSNGESSKIMDEDSPNRKARLEREFIDNLEIPLHPVDSHNSQISVDTLKDRSVDYPQENMVFKVPDKRRLSSKHSTDRKTIELKDTRKRGENTHRFAIYADILKQWLTPSDPLRSIILEISPKIARFINTIKDDFSKHGFKFTSPTQSDLWSQSSQAEPSKLREDQGKMVVGAPQETNNPVMKEFERHEPQSQDSLSPINREGTKLKDPMLQPIVLPHLVRMISEIFNDASVVLKLSNTQSASLNAVQASHQQDIDRLVKDLSQSKLQHDAFKVRSAADRDSLIRRNEYLERKLQAHGIQVNPKEIPLDDFVIGVGRRPKHETMIDENRRLKTQLKQLQRQLSIFQASGVAENFLDPLSKPPDFDEVEPSVSQASGRQESVVNDFDFEAHKQLGAITQLIARGPPKKQEIEAQQKRRARIESFYENHYASTSSAKRPTNYHMKKIEENFASVREGSEPSNTQSPIYFQDSSRNREAALAAASKFQDRRFKVFQDSEATSIASGMVNSDQRSGLGVDQQQIHLLASHKNLYQEQAAMDSVSFNNLSRINSEGDASGEGINKDQGLTHSSQTRNVMTPRSRIAQLSQRPVNEELKAELYKMLSGEAEDINRSSNPQTQRDEVDMLGKRTPADFYQEAINQSNSKLSSATGTSIGRTLLNTIQVSHDENARLTKHDLAEKETRAFGDFVQNVYEDSNAMFGRGWVPSSTLNVNNLGSHIDRTKFVASNPETEAADNEQSANKNRLPEDGIVRARKQASKAGTPNLSDVHMSVKSSSLQNTFATEPTDSVVSEEYKAFSQSLLQNSGYMGGMQVSQMASQPTRQGTPNLGGMRAQPVIPTYEPNLSAYLQPVVKRRGRPPKRLQAGYLSSVQTHSNPLPGSATPRLRSHPQAYPFFAQTTPIVQQRVELPSYPASTTALFPETSTGDSFSGSSGRLGWIGDREVSGPLPPNPKPHKRVYRRRQKPVAMLPPETPEDSSESETDNDSARRRHYDDSDEEESEQEQLSREERMMLLHLTQKQRNLKMRGKSDRHSKYRTPGFKTVVKTGSKQINSANH